MIEKIEPINRHTYKINCKMRAIDNLLMCQVCGKEIIFSGNWQYDCWFFDHILPRDKCTREQFENGFVFIHRELHIFKNSLAPNLKKTRCVKYFHKHFFYSNKSRLFYQKFLIKRPDAIPIKIDLTRTK